MSTDGAFIASYFNGLSAIPIAVRVERAGGTLQIRANGLELSWDLEECVIENLGESYLKIHLRKDADAYLAVSDAETAAALHRMVEDQLRHFTRFNPAALRTYALGFLVVSVLLIWIAKNVVPQLAWNLPVSVERAIFEPWLDELTRTRCDIKEVDERIQRYVSWLSDGAPQPVMVGSSGMVNAFAVPGGMIIVNHGLIAATETPEELIGVMAHEVAHVQRRHVSQSLVRNLFLSGWLVGLGGQFVGGAAAVSPVLVVNTFSRALEEEADRIAVSKLDQLGIARKHLAEFFLRELKARKKPSELASKVESFVSTHPSDDDRAETIRRLPAQASLRADAEAIRIQLEQDREDWVAFRRRCHEFSTPGVKEEGES